MRRPISVALTGLVVAGCAASDVTEPQAPPDPIAAPPVSLAAAPFIPQNVGPAIDDAINRLVPALGPGAAALGQQLRQLRAAGGQDVQIIDGAQRKLANLTRSIAPAALPDADALAFTLEMLRSPGT